jgi:hypothetical protein
MAGKRGRSGRPQGSFSRFKNPVALAGYHLIGLKRLWRAGVPIQIGTDRSLVQPSELGSLVPSKVEHVLAEIAIAHLFRLYAQLARLYPDSCEPVDSREPVEPFIADQSESAVVPQCAQFITDDWVIDHAPQPGFVCVAGPFVYVTEQDAAKAAVHFDEVARLPGGVLKLTRRPVRATALAVDRVTIKPISWPRVEQVLDWAANYRAPSREHFNSL